MPAVHRLKAWRLCEPAPIPVFSLRSKSPKADVSKVCSQFGGGGHTLAAGARARGTLAEVQEQVLAAIDLELSKL